MILFKKLEKKFHEIVGYLKTFLYFCNVSKRQENIKILVTKI